MNKPVIVPDASVLLKWSFDSGDESEQDKALALRHLWLAGLLRIILPSLWTYEIGNVLCTKNPGLAREILEVYVGYQFEEERAADLYDDIIRIVAATKATFYDAAYHAVAIRHKGTLVTADERYIRKAAAIGHAVLLKDWTNAA
jgi:predicted nucleic acid-binding protein